MSSYKSLMDFSLGSCEMQVPAVHPGRASPVARVPEQMSMLLGRKEAWRHSLHVHFVKQTLCGPRRKETEESSGVRPKPKGAQGNHH